MLSSAARTLLAITFTVSMPAFAKSEKPSPPESRSTASSETRESIARKHMDIAEGLAQARRQNLVCDMDAYESEILENVRKARQFDSNIVVTSEVQRLMGDTLPLRFIMQGREALEKGGKHPAILTGVRFHAPAMGAYGSTMTLRLQAAGKLDVMTLDIDNDAPNWKTTSGTWQFINHKNGPTLVLTTQNGSGKNATRSYRINNGYANGELDGALVPGNKDRKLRNEGREPGYFEIRFFGLMQGECEA